VYYSSIINPDIIVPTGNSPAYEVFADNNTLDMKSILTYIAVSLFALIFILLSIRCIIELITVVKTYLKNEKGFIEDTRVCLLSQKEEAYSFFKWIFIYPQLYSRQSLKEVLIHEATHVSQCHSFDVMLGEIISMICWINPFAWLLKKEISINHEHIADQEVMRAGFDKKEYQYHMIGMEHSPKAAANLYNYFSVLPLKRRITMLNRKRTNHARRIKYLTFIPLAAGLLIINNIDSMARIVNEQFSTHELAIANPEPEIIKNNMTDVDSYPQDNKVYTQVDKAPEFTGGNSGLMKFIKENLKYPVTAFEKGLEGRVVVYFIVEKNGSLSDIKVTRSVDTDLDKEAIRVVNAMPKWTPGIKDGNPVRTPVTVPVVFTIPKDEVNTPQAQASSAKLSPDNSVFKVVSKMPEFPGGDMAMFKFVQENLKYPVEAQEKEIQGSPIVGFIVEKDGKLTNFKIKRAADPSLNKEALRIAQMMPKWTPGEDNGKILRVEYNLPLTFRLQ